MCHAGDTDAVLALLYTGPILWIFFCLFLPFCFSKPKLARTQHKFEKTQRVHIQRSGTQHRYPYGMPALGHRIIGLSALLAQQPADSATHVPQGTPSPQTESSSGTGTSGPASTAAQARAAE